MDRWSGVLKVPLNLNPNSTGAFCKVAASLLFSPSSKTLIAPSVNAIFFNGDRVQGTGNPVIERLSDSRYIADLLVSKLGSSANAWVLEASSFNGPFALYKEFVPSVNSIGDPRCYDSEGFPASSSIAKILSNSVQQIRSILSSRRTELVETTMQSSAPQAHAAPKTIILGFSKGGTVVNQIIAELAHSKPVPCHDISDHIYSTSKDEFLSSIYEIHYVDVGLNSNGAYLTDMTVIKRAVENLLVNHDRIRFVLHGTPRQWCDKNRPWIRKEKDILLHLLKEQAHRCEGKLQMRRLRCSSKGRPPIMYMKNHPRELNAW